MLDPSDPQSWNAYSYVNNNPLRRVDRDGRGFWEKLGNLFSGYGWRTNQEVAVEVERRRDWLNTTYYERDAQGNWHHFNASNLSPSGVWTTYDIIQEERVRGNLHELTPEEIAQAIPNPALKGDPYHPDEVTKRQETELNALDKKCNPSKGKPNDSDSIVESLRRERPLTPTVKISLQTAGDSLLRMLTATAEVCGKCLIGPEGDLELTTQI